MKKLQPFLFLLFLVSSFNLSALNISAGTYYFDNSKTQWTTIQFLYGTDNPASYTIINLTNKGNNHWELVIPSNEQNIYRYSFTFTNLATGKYTDRSFSGMKDHISNNLGRHRTATTSNEMIVGATYTPTSGDNWAQGNWITNAVPSGTLPVFYLNTENNAEIVSKDYYINATMYIDALGLPNYTSSGTAADPIITETKGRGNYTWKDFDKKPYRLKMNKKASLLNMSGDKSYNLLAHADDPTFLRNEVGFELSRLLGMKYTPKQEPVELVKNGKYHGLYFLTDHIKVSSERVNITEQNDNETNPDFVTGGWLIEIDNYADVGQVSTNRVPRFTHKSPEVLSSQQNTYIRTFLQKVEDAIYNSNKNSTDWENYIDLNTLVDFYIIQEIVGNTESFNGSCYFTKDRGSDTKLFFGPVWDFGNAFRHGHKFIYQDIQFSSHWLPEIVKYPRFQQQVEKRWTELRHTQLPKIYTYIDQFTAKVTSVIPVDYSRWPQYGSRSYSNDVQTVKNYLTDRIAWLDTKWYKNTSSPEVQANTISVYPNPTEGDIYINSSTEVEKVELYSLTGICLQTFREIDNKITPNVESGTYLLKISTQNGAYIKTIIIKNR